MDLKKIYTLLILGLGLVTMGLFFLKENKVFSLILVGIGVIVNFFSGLFILNIEKN